MAYFGITPTGMSRYLPSYCTIDTGLSCMDHRVVYNAPEFEWDDPTNDFIIVVKNNRGEDFKVTKVKIMDEYGKEWSPFIEGGQPLPNGEKTTIPVDKFRVGESQVLAEGESYAFDFIVYVTNDVSKLPHQYKGYARGKVS